MADDKKISGLAVASAPTGVELVEIVQGGVNKQTTTQDIANLGGGGSVTSVSGTTNRITSTGGATPVINIDAAYDAAVTAEIAAATATATVVSATTATAGATITLDMDSKIQKIHVGDNPFAGAKTLAMSNTTNALDFIFIFEITNLAAVLTFPADWISDDFNFDGTAWTPGEIGKYKMGGPFDGTNWHVSIVGPNA